MIKHGCKSTLADSRALAEDREKGLCQAPRGRCFSTAPSTAFGSAAERRPSDPSRERFGGGEGRSVGCRAFQLSSSRNPG